MFKLLKRTENADHSERFAMQIDTHFWGISVWYDYDFYRTCKFLIIQFLCFRCRWRFYKEHSNG